MKPIVPTYRSVSFEVVGEHDDEPVQGDQVQDDQREVQLERHRRKAVALIGTAKWRYRGRISSRLYHSLSSPT